MLASVVVGAASVVSQEHRWMHVQANARLLMADVSCTLDRADLRSIMVAIVVHVRVCRQAL